MAKRSELPTLAVAVLDSDPELAAALRSTIEAELSSVARSRQIKVLAFDDARDAADEIRSMGRDASRALEACLFVSDTVGFRPRRACAANVVRTHFPWSSIGIHSEEGDGGVFEGLHESGLADWRVPKGDPNHVSEVVVSRLDAYLGSERIASLSQYILGACEGPDVPFFRGEFGVYSMLDIYWRVVTGAKDATLLWDLWNEVLEIRSMR